VPISKETRYVLLEKVFRHGDKATAERLLQEEMKTDYSDFDEN